MKRVPFSQRVIATISFEQSAPGQDVQDPVQWNMPDTVMRLFRAEARKRKSDLNTLIADFVCSALTKRAEAIRQHKATGDAAAFDTDTIALVVPDPRPATATDTPTAVRYQAEELVDRGWQSRGQQRQRLARQALVLWPDCADAYVLLGRTAKNREEARRFYEQGVQAGEQALGSELFVREVGHFWLLLETRPYMRARQGLAYTLWHLGERQAAISHLWAMLQLNPNDNQGMRYLLGSWLLAVNDAAGVDRLLALFPDEWSAHTAYTKALHLFRREGESQEANSALREALQINAFVPLYLLGEKARPTELPEYVGMGDENEAVSYVAEGTEPWQDTVGALEWLASARSRTQQRQR